MRRIAVVAGAVTITLATVLSGCGGSSADSTRSTATREAAGAAGDVAYGIASSLNTAVVPYPNGDTYSGPTVLEGCTVDATVTCAPITQAANDTVAIAAFGDRVFTGGINGAVQSCPAPTADAPTAACTDVRPAGNQVMALAFAGGRVVVAQGTTTRTAPPYEYSKTGLASCRPNGGGCRTLADDARGPIAANGENVIAVTKDGSGLITCVARPVPPTADAKASPVCTPLSFTGQPGVIRALAVSGTTLFMAGYRDNNGTAALKACPVAGGACNDVALPTNTKDPIYNARTLAAAADGAVYVGGGEEPGYFNDAGFVANCTPSACTLISEFKSRTAGQINSIAATPTAIYVGGLGEANLWKCATDGTGCAKITSISGSFNRQSMGAVAAD